MAIRMVAGRDGFQIGSTIRERRSGPSATSDVLGQNWELDPFRAEVQTREVVRYSVREA